MKALSALAIAVLAFATAAPAEVLAPCASAPTILFLKTAPPTQDYNAGNFTYTISLDIQVINGTAGCTLNGVTVTDPLPALAQFQSASTPAGWTATLPTVGTSGTVTFTHSGNIGSTGVHAFGITISAPAGANGTTFSNTATVAGTNPAFSTPSTASTLITPVHLQSFTAD